jgi:hypothetical protein
MAYKSFEDLEVWQSAYLHTAKGSFAELRTQLHIAGEVSIIHLHVRKELIGDLATPSKKLHRLIRTYFPKSNHQSTKTKT